MEWPVYRRERETVALVADKAPFPREKKNPKCIK